MYTLTYFKILTRKKYPDIGVFAKDEAENITESSSPSL